MIYELSRDVESKLRARGFPVRVEYGPERVKREGVFDNTIILSRPGGTREPATMSPRGSGKNPNYVAVRQVAARAVIFARSNIPGARVNEHECVLDALLDALIVALFESSSESRGRITDILDSRLVTAEDLLGLPEEFLHWPGRVHMLQFLVPRAVRAVNWEGEKNPEAVIAAVNPLASVLVQVDGERTEKIK